MKQKWNSKEASASTYLPSLEATTSRKHEVFLSFRGPDTRNKFTSHLYEGLTRVGISVFKDDVEMDKGEDINEALKMAINDSRICIPIFSKDYASSKACLQELSQMVLEHKSIIPIFYDVGADDVKLKTDLYKNAVEEYQQKGTVGKEEVEMWKNAFSKVGKILGYDIMNKNEADKIGEIVQDVSNQLMPRYQNLRSHFIEIGDEVESVIKMLDLESKGCRIVGLCGMGGIGKTTMAQAVFNRLSNNFKNCCTFIENVRESVENNKLRRLQRQLYKELIDPKFAGSIDNVNNGINMIKRGLENKRFLLVLDDMDDANLLTNFVGDHAGLANGSRIIITTRNKKVLDTLKVQLDNNRAVVKVYQVQKLDVSRARQLFSRYAFNMVSPPKKLERLSEEVVSSLDGHPLALRVIGSSLFGHSEKAWKEAVENLKEIPDNKEIESALKISYRGLSRWEREIFLDIACYTGSLEKTGAYYMWEDCGWCPHISVQNLIDKSLVKVEAVKEFHGEVECLWMHDVLKDLGRDIIKEARKKDGRKGQKLLHIGEDVFSRGKIGQKLDAIPNEERKYVEMLDIYSYGGTITSKHLVDFENVRFLRLRVGEIVGNFEGLFPNLRWISISRGNNFKATNFDPKNLVVLQLYYAFEDWWIQMKAHKLKVLEIIDFFGMKRTPSFKEFSSLEVLTLDGCQSLVRIDSSIGDLKNLIRFNIRNCPSLSCLPQTIGNAKDLEEIILRGNHKRFYMPCSVGNLKNLSQLHLIDIQLEELEDWIGNLLFLRELDLSGTCIKVLPDAIGQLTELKVLRMNNCPIRKLPTTIGSLMKIEELEARGCWEFEGDIPSVICLLSCLRILDLRKTPICKMPKLPTSLKRLLLNNELVQIEIDSHNLHELVNIVELLLFCKCGDNPFNVPHGQFDPRCLNFQWIRRLSKLEKLYLCIPYVTTGLENVNELFWLKELHLSFAKFQDSLQFGPRLSHLTLKDCKFPGGILDVSHMKMLRELKILGCDIREIRGLRELNSLSYLCISELRSLSSLKLWNNENLAMIWFDGLDSLTDLSIRDCPSLENFSNLSNLRSLSSLELWNCTKVWIHEFNEMKSLTNLSLKNLGIGSLELRSLENLKGIVGLDGLETLTELSIYCCPSIEDLPCLSKLRSLSSLELSNCENLKEIVGLDGLETLTELSINRCPSIKDLPCLSKLRSLSSLELWSCENLKEIVGLDGLETLTKLSIYCCPFIKDLPCLSKLRSLSSLELSNCANLKEIVGLDGLDTLSELSINCCPSIEDLPCLSKLRSLSSLELLHCENLKEIVGLDGLETLIELSINCCPSIKDLPCLSKLRSLSSLELWGCENLKEIVGLDELETLTKLSINYCPSIKDLPCLSKLRSLSSLELSNCENLKEIVGLDGLETLRELFINCCPSIEDLPCLSKLRSLSSLELSNCENLKGIVQLHGLDSLSGLKISYLGIDSLELIACRKLEYVGGVCGLHSLTGLSICNCPSLRSLPNLSVLGNLKCLTLHNCEGLKCIEGLTVLESLEKVYITQCKSLKIKPYDLFKLNNTTSGYIEDCGETSRKEVPSRQMDISYFRSCYDLNKGCGILAERAELNPKAELGLPGTSRNNW